MIDAADAPALAVQILWVGLLKLECKKRIGNNGLRETRTQRKSRGFQRVRSLGAVFSALPIFVPIFIYWVLAGIQALLARRSDSILCRSWHFFCQRRCPLANNGKKHAKITRPKVNCARLFIFRLKSCSLVETFIINF
jgi:hypothetical protein